MAGLIVDRNTDKQKIDRTATGTLAVLYPSVGNYEGALIDAHDAALAAAAAAATAETNAETAETNAETAQAAAEVARAGAEAVGTTTDGVMTGVDANAASAFRVQQDARHTATIAGVVDTNMYVTFEDKANGDPPAVADTGQAATFLTTATGDKAQVSSGRLIHGTLPASGAFANYYQIELSAKATLLMVRYEWPSSPDANGLLCIGAWASVYQASAGNPVPSSVAHLTLKPGTGATGSYTYSVWNGAVGGIADVKSGSFANQPTDGHSLWVCAILIDRAAGQINVLLPDGTTFIVTAAEISAAFVAATLTDVPLADLGAEVAFVEHFASTAGNAGIYPKVIDFAADTDARPPLKRRGVTMDLFLRALRAIPATVKHMIHQPTTQYTLALSTTLTGIDISNCYVVATAGPSGKIIVQASAYYEFSADTAVFWRLRRVDSPSGANAASGTIVSPGFRASGAKDGLSAVMELTGLTPGNAYIVTMQHSMAAGGGGTLYAGGTGGSQRPAVSLVVLPE